MRDGNTQKVVDYLDGFQYSNAMPEFFPTSEGYVKVTVLGTPSSSVWMFNYVYNHVDHLGNIRLSYTKDPQTGNLRILDENHYYPFGLRHNKTSSLTIVTPNFVDVIVAPTTNHPFDYRFQGQELQEEHDLNWYAYRYRNYDPAIGRFFNVDPLAEEYHEWGAYVFSGNRVVDSFELEGLEPVHHDEIVQGDRVIDEYGWEWVSNGTEWTIALDQTNITSNGNVSRGLQPMGIEMAPIKMDADLLPMPEWTDNSIYNEGTYHTNGIFYSQLNGNTTSTNSTSFDFRAIDYNGGLNYNTLNTNLNLNAINVQGGLSVPFLIGKENKVQAYLAGTMLEGTLSLEDKGFVNLETAITGRVATGYAGIDIQGYKSSGLINVGLYGAISEVEGKWGLSSKNGRWGLNATYTVPVGASGATGGVKLGCSKQTGICTFGAAGKAADILGLGLDIEITFPNPFQ